MLHVNVYCTGDPRGRPYNNSQMQNFVLPGLIYNRNLFIIVGKANAFLRRPNMQEINVPLQAEQDARTLVERRAAGRALRNKASRSSHAAWAPAINRPVPLSLLEEQNRSRLAHLVPLRFQRMSVSPFTFLRGSAIVMAQDLATTPVTGIRAQIRRHAQRNHLGRHATREPNR